MRILLVNYRYFISGGPERYMFSIVPALEARGHEVIPFSIRYTQNRATPYETYFADPLAGPDAVRFHQHRWTPRAFARSLERSFYSREVEQAVSRLVSDTRPDVAFVFHFLRKLSPSVLAGIKRHGVPIATIIWDYLLVCPAIHCLRDGRPCTLCIKGNLWPSVRYRCVQDSLGASLVSLASTYYHRRRRYFDLVNRYIVINRFAADIFRQAGWPMEKFTLLHLFADPAVFRGPAVPAPAARERYVLFSGRVERHKGPDVLIRAYAEAVARFDGNAPRLKIAGRAEDDFGARCKSLAAELGVAAKTDFLGFVDGDALRALFAQAMLTVIPSIWYENLPIVLIESYASGTPVIGSGHGSIAPYIEEGVTGATFQPSNPHSLADRLVEAWQNPERWQVMGRNARAKAEELFSEDAHMKGLLGVFDRLAASGGIHARE